MTNGKLTLHGIDSDTTGQLTVSVEGNDKSRSDPVTYPEMPGWLDYRPFTGELSLDGRCRSLWGLGSDDAINISIFLAGVHPEDLPRVRAAIEEVLNSDQAGRLEIECRVQPRDGARERWVQISGRLLLEGDNGSGQSARLVGAVRDMTDCKKQEREYKKLEAKYRDIVKYAPFGMYEFDFQGPRFRIVNDLMCQYLGYTREELMSMNPLSLLDDRCAAIVRERVRKRQAEEAVDNSVEMKVIAKDGRIYYAILYIILTYSDGKPDGAIVIGHDVTEHRKAECIIRENESRAEKLLDITRALGSIGFNSRSLLDVIVKRTGEVLGDSCDIALVSGDGKLLESQATYCQDNRESMKPSLDRFMGYPCKAGEGLPGKVMETGAPRRIPVLIPGRAKEDGADTFEALVDVCPVHSVLVVPLKVREQVTGTISVFRHSPARPYTKNDQALLQDIADRAALSIENTRLFEAMEQEIAVRKRTERELLAAKQQAELYLDLMSHDINNMHLVARAISPGAGHEKR